MRSFMGEVKTNIDDVLDVHHMVVTNLVKNKALMNRVRRRRTVTFFVLFYFLVFVGFADWLQAFSVSGRLNMKPFLTNQPRLGGAK